MRKKILGINIDFGYTTKEVLDEIEKLLKTNKTHLVATTNPYFVMVAQKDSKFKKIINNAAISVPDGVGILYANLYLNKIKNIKRDFLFIPKALVIGLYTGIYGYINRKELGKTITGVELTYKLCELAEKKGYTIFFLGGRPRDKSGQGITDSNFSMSEEAMIVMQERHPNIHFVGSTSDFNKQSYDDEKTILYIHKAMKEKEVKCIDLLFVAYDPVWQEKWIHRNANKIPARVCLGIGRTFDYIAGYMKEPNKKYDKLHIQWLYSLILQPWRYRRVFMTFPLFPLKVFLNSLSQKQK